MIVRREDLSKANAPHWVNTHITYDEETGKFTAWDETEAESLGEFVFWKDAAMAVLLRADAMEKEYQRDELDALLKEIKKNTTSNLNLQEETFAALDKLTALVDYLGLSFVQKTDGTYECREKENNI